MTTLQELQEWLQARVRAYSEELDKRQRREQSFSDLRDYSEDFLRGKLDECKDILSALK